VRHPFEALRADKRKFIFLSLAALTLVVMGVLNVIDGPLETAAAPQGIVSFELAGDGPSAQAILDSWDCQARAHAGFSLGFDFVFMLLYSSTIGLACVWAARVLPGRYRSLVAVGLMLAWGQWLAALLDMVENVALLIILLDSPGAPWPQVARWCVVPKFALVFLGLAYAVLAVVVRLVGSHRPGGE
jgi:hypothetical protein